MRLLFIIGLMFIVGSDGFFWVGRSSRRARQAKQRAERQRLERQRLEKQHTLSNATRSERMLTDNLFLKNVANYSH